MQARVKSTSRYGVITAFTGKEFVRYEWRAVPEGCEDEAKRHPFLEVRGEGAAASTGRKEADFSKDKEKAEKAAKAKAEKEAKEAAKKAAAPNVKAGGGRAGLFGRRPKDAGDTNATVPPENASADDAGGEKG